MPAGVGIRGRRAHPSSATFDLDGMRVWDGAFPTGMTTRPEFRVALTVPDFDAALAFYRDALGLEQVGAWSGDNGRVVLLEGGRATLELFDEPQAAYVDGIEAGARVSGTVRFAIEVPDSDEAARKLVAAGA